MNLASDLNGDQPPAEYFVESVQDCERALAARSRYEPCRNPWFVRIFRSHFPFATRAYPGPETPKALEEVLPKAGNVCIGTE